MIDEVLVFLDGRTEEVVRRVRERMELAAESLDFERAAELRDVLRHLEKMEEPTVVMKVEGGDRDVVGYARDGDDAVVALMRIRGGKLLAREHQFLENIEEETDGAVLEAYLAGKYLPLEDRAARAARALRAGGARARRGIARAHEDSRAAARTASRADRPRDSRTRGTCSRSCGSPATRRRSAPAIPSTSSSGSSDSRKSRARSCASTSRTRRARTPWRRASGSRTVARIAPSIASSR